MKAKYIPPPPQEGRVEFHLTKEEVCLLWKIKHTIDDAVYAISKSSDQEGSLFGFNKAMYPPPTIGYSRYNDLCWLLSTFFPEQHFETFEESE